MARTWMVYNACPEHAYPGEWCHRVNGFRAKPPKNDPVAEVAGNRQYGFTTRPVSSGNSVITEVDGQPYAKSGRKSVAGHQKEPCRLISTARIKKAQVTPAMRQERLAASLDAQKSWQRRRRKRLHRQGVHVGQGGLR